MFVLLGNGGLVVQNGGPAGVAVRRPGAAKLQELFGDPVFAQKVDFTGEFTGFLPEREIN